MQTSHPTSYQDPTIARTVDAMRITDEHRPGQVGFFDDHGSHHWLDESSVDDFIQKHGSELPSDYLERNGTPWLQQFFSLS